MARPYLALIKALRLRAYTGDTQEAAFGARLKPKRPKAPRPPTPPALGARPRGNPAPLRPYTPGTQEGSGFFRRRMP